MLHKPDESAQYTDEMKWDHIKKGLAGAIHRPKYATWFLIELLEELRDGAGGEKTVVRPSAPGDDEEVKELKSRCEALETTIAGLTSVVTRLENAAKKAAKESAPKPSPMPAPGPEV